MGEAVRELGNWSNNGNMQADVFAGRTYSSGSVVVAAMRRVDRTPREVGCMKCPKARLGINVCFPASTNEGAAGFNGCESGRFLDKISKVVTAVIFLFSLEIQDLSNEPH